ncbi:oligoendopeptidase F [Thermotalea metallivorans]|uniref:Oligopeptidase F n=1 Tax=Thermotalea metallivorans TaxID=520762 RepID=A0A140L4E2_9FIRM|nr:oligoendopeptidase F [Thermotalea metallivorans]KXG75417.1 Oligoendopeptidase F, plasmid [Thermotalea metallivorans]
MGYNKEKNIMMKSRNQERRMWFLPRQGNMNRNKKNIPKRSEVPFQWKWKLEQIYETDKHWEKDFSAIESMLEDIEKYVGKLGNSSQCLYEALNLSDHISRKLENVFIYAKMRKDEDNTVSKYQAMTDRAQSLSVAVHSRLSFMVPEILSIPEDRIKGFLKENEKLTLYTFYLEEILRQKSHVLSKEEEQILAQVGELAAAPKNIFGMINNADIKFPTIRDEKGEEIEVTKGRYVKLLESEDRRVRRDAFRALYSSYEKQKNTIAATLNYSVKKDVFYARVRKYESSLQASLDGDNIPLSVYDNLIEAVHGHLDSMYRYMALRKKALGIDELHMYDLYTPMVKAVKMHIPYQEAKQKVKLGLAPLGEEYVSLLEKGFTEGWIDVYENEGKTSGAYSWGSYDSPPFVLLNYQDSIHDLFTLAHEMGHSLHTYYANHHQPYPYAGYKIFVAEVASTVNEALLMEYLLNHIKEENMRMYLLNHYLEQFRTTLYRQTMFAEFEKIIHEKVEKGEPLTPELLCEVYGELNRKYYGPEVMIDDEIKMEWARIPHFYNAFYVYKYATGFSAAISLSQQILKEGAPAVDRYIGFLKKGGSDYPIALLKGAGVDMTTAAPMHDALEVFEKLLNELEKGLQ